MRIWLIAALCCFAPAVTPAQSCPIDISRPGVIKLRLPSVVFENTSLLSPEQQAEISKTSVSDDDAAERVRRAYEDAGYFKVRVEGKTSWVPGGSSEGKEIVVDVLDPGPQYRLGDVNFAGAHAFSESQLRSLFSIEPGDIFQRSVIETGLDKLHQLYESQGYVNFRVFPDARFDQDSATTNLTIDIDEGKQFHLRDIQVVTINSVTKANVLNDIDQAPGQVFNSEAWDRLFEKIHVFLPNATPDMIKKNLDERGTWIDIVLDLRKSDCPSQ